MRRKNKSKKNISKSVKVADENAVEVTTVNDENNISEKEVEISVVENPEKNISTESKAVEQDLIQEISEVKEAQNVEETLPLGNEMEQQLAQAEAQPQPQQPTTETNPPPEKVKKRFEKILRKDGKGYWYKYAKDGQQPKQETKKVFSSEENKKEESEVSTEETQFHNEDVISTIIDGSIKPLVAWRAKVDYQDLLDTPAEKRMLKNIQPDGGTLSKKSWLLYFIVQGCLIIGKTLRSKFKHFLNPDGTVKEEVTKTEK